MKKINFLIDEFMIYCDSENYLKTMMCYEQILRLFFKYLEEERNIIDAIKVIEKVIRKYINHIKNIGKYIVVIDNKTLKINTPEIRKDYGKKFL